MISHTALMRVLYCYDVEYTSILYIRALKPLHGRFRFIQAQTILRQADFFELQLLLDKLLYNESIHTDIAPTHNKNQTDGNTYKKYLV